MFPKINVYIHTDKVVLHHLEHPGSDQLSREVEQSEHFHCRRLDAGVHLHLTETSMI